MTQDQAAQLIALMYSQADEISGLGLLTGEIRHLAELGVIFLAVLIFYAVKLRSPGRGG